MVEPLDDGRSSVTLEIATVGVLAGVVALLLGSLTRRYVSLEASSLKRRCEAARPTR